MAGSTITTISDGASAVNWRAPFLTAALNTHMAVNTEPGIYRGFLMRRDAGTALGVLLGADPEALDHYLFYLTGTYGVGVWLQGGDIALDLTPFASQTVVIAIFVSYAIGSTTVAQIRAYQLSPTDQFTGAAERGELVVIGTVVVPASGIIPALNVTPAGRSSAWAARAPEATPWAPLLRNGGFEWRDAAASRWGTSFWEDDLGASWGVGVVRTGARALGLIGTGSTQTGAISQYLHLPIFPDVYPQGPRLRVRFWVKVAQVSTAGSLLFGLEFTDSNNATPAAVEITIATASVDASWRLVDVVVAAPAAARFLRRAYFKAVGANFGSSALGVSLDDVQVFLDRGGALFPQWDQERHLTPLRAAPLVLGDASQTLSAGTSSEVALYLDSSLYGGEGGMVGGYRAPAGQSFAPVFAWSGRADLGASLIANQGAAARPRIRAAAASGGGVLTLVTESPISGGIALRRYVDASGNLIETWNALWHLGTASKWSKDVNGTQAWKKTHSGGATVTLATKAAADNTAWDDAGWTYSQAVGATATYVDALAALTPKVFGYTRDHATITIQPLAPFMVFDSAGVMRTVSTTLATVVAVADVLPAAGSFTATSWYFLYVKIVAGAPVFFLSEAFPVLGSYYPNMTGNTGARYLASFWSDGSSRLRASTFQGGQYVWDEIATDHAEMLVNGNATSWTAVSVANDVPPHSQGNALITVDVRAKSETTVDHTVSFRPGSPPAVLSHTQQLYVGGSFLNSVTPTYSTPLWQKDMILTTDSGGGIQYMVSFNQVFVWMSVKGWRDNFHR